MSNEYYYQGTRYLKAADLHTLKPFNGELFQESCRSQGLDPMHFVKTIEDAGIFLWDNLTEGATLYTRRNLRGNIQEEPKPCLAKDGTRYGSININCKGLFPNMLKNGSDKALGFGVTTSNMLQASRHFYDLNPIGEFNDDGQMPLFDEVLDEAPSSTTTVSTVSTVAQETNISELYDDHYKLQEIEGKLKTTEEEFSKLKRFCMDSVPQKYHTMEFYNLLAKDEIVKIFNPNVG